MRGASATTAQKVCPSCRDQFSGDALFCPNDGSRLLPLEPPPPSIIPTEGPRDSYLGREISGHIEIRELAGVGAMGRVYRAFQKGIDRDVAVKILHRELSANPQLVARFHREAKVASRLQHPNVVHVHLAGQLPDGALYIVMEYLDGVSLQSALAAAADAGSVMPLHRALHIALQLCDAVGEAHAQGIVHRDLKPENVMLVRRGEDADYVKVLDFGIARLSWGEQSMATAAGLIFGTARYISPEGAQGESVGPPGDVYAIATLLYQMLSGRTPFEGEQAVGILIQQIHDAPPPLKSLANAAQVPDALADIVMQNLSKDRNARLPDARVLGRALLDVMRVSGSAARVSLVGGESFPEVPSVELQVGKAPPTTRWMPPASVQAKLALPPTPSALPLAKTVDDASLENPMALGTPVPGLGATARMPIVTPPPGSLPPVHSPSFPPVTPRPGARPSKPVSFVETTLSDVTDPPAQTTHPPAEPELPVRPSRRFARFAAIFIVLFLVGSAGSAFVAYRYGFLRSPTASSVDDTVVRARKALAEGRWDAPPGDNVQDLTSEGLTQAPGEPRLLEVRTKAGEALMKQAIAAKAAGDLAQAVRSLELATKLDPNDATKRELLREYQNDVTRSPGLNPDGLMSLSDAGASGGRASASARAQVETAPPKPRIGQQVDFSAKLGGEPKSVSGARFTVQGPGLGKEGASLTAMNENGAWRASFTFLEAGRYEVTFVAKVDGASARGSRMVLVEGPNGAGAGEASAPSASAPASSTPAPSAGPAPSGSAKWL